MTEDPRADLVARQYKKWRYPEPIEDLQTWYAGSGFDYFDPSHAHRIYWPDRQYRPEMDILIAGCGTNQAPTIAYTNPEARVVGIDISQESLDHGRFLKEKHSLRNLELTLLPIEEAGALGRDFDLIVSSGVLHHMASPQAGMDALAPLLRADGVAAIMLYARYGRIGVEAMQTVFREMGLRQDEHSLRLVRTALDWLDPTHPARVYMGVATDLAYDAGMVDTFLHGRDVSFTVSDCLTLVEQAGLVFQDWFHKTPVYPPTLVEPDNEFLAAVAGLPQRTMWSVMEPLRNQSGIHLFTACPTQRLEIGYRIDFSASEAIDYVPIWRHRCGVEGEALLRPGWEVWLQPADLALAREVDGQRSIGEIAQRTARPVADAAQTFQGLWTTDFIAIGLGVSTP